MKLALFIIALIITITQSFEEIHISDYEREEIDSFNEYRDDIELIRDYVLDNFDCDSKDESVDMLVVRDENGEISGLFEDGEDIIPPEDVLQALKRADYIMFSGSLPFIEVTKKRVTFGDEGRRMYVYSRNGKKPDYYFHKGDGMHPDIYKLGDGWYVMTLTII